MHTNASLSVKCLAAMHISQASMRDNVLSVFLISFLKIRRVC